MTLTDQMIQFHHKEPWQSDSQVSDEELRHHFDKLISDKRLVTFFDGEKLVGYCEYTRIGYALLGWIIIHGSVGADIYDKNGNIIYISNMFVEEPYRGSKIIEYFKSRLEELNPQCEYYAGKSVKKGYAPHKIWKKN